jgi:hypothetical protein
MPIFDAKSIPAEVHSSTKDPEVTAFLKTRPMLGAHKSITDFVAVHESARGPKADICDRWNRGNGRTVGRAGTMLCRSCWSTFRPLRGTDGSGG